MIIIKNIIKKYNLNIDVDTIFEMWNESHRGYHSISHLKDLINMIFLDKDKYNIIEYDSLILSAIFHDIIYNPSKNDNEEQSAYFFKSKFPVNYSNTLDNVYDMIIATKNHTSNKHLEKIFNTYDMDIVNRNFEELMEWERGIQKEYLAIYNKDLYKSGRLYFLEKLIKEYPKNEHNLSKLIDYVKNM
jgi:predicted metal-dependent HD superfamily phosphohydrolase